MRARTDRTRRDDGFTIVEVLVALAVIGIVLTSTTAVYVRSMLVVDEQGVRQTAYTVATDGMESFRGAGSGKQVAWLRTAPATKVVNGVTYNLTWRCGSGSSSKVKKPPDLEKTNALCSDPVAFPTPDGDTDDVVYVQLIVRWTGRTCPPGGCVYGGAVTEISIATIEPVFDATS